MGNTAQPMQYTKAVKSGMTVKPVQPVISDAQKRRVIQKIINDDLLTLAQKGLLLYLIQNRHKDITIKSLISDHRHHKVAFIRAVVGQLRYHGLCRPRIGAKGLVRPAILQILERYGV